MVTGRFGSTMVRFLRFFTVVGNNHQAASKWDQEELHKVSRDLESVKLTATRLTFREGLKRLFSSERFQIAVVSLVILNAVFVLYELLLDMSIIQAEKHIAPWVFHYLLTFFMLELGFKLYAYRLEFFNHKIEVFDAIVVIVFFILYIISRENTFNGIGLLILLRLSIIGIVLSIKVQANHKVKEENDRLFQQISELQEHKTAMEEEVSELRALLTKHSIQHR